MLLMLDRGRTRRTGRLGCGGGPLILFSPPRFCEATILEKGVGDHRHESVTVKTLPGSPLEVIEAEFFFQLLVCLLAYPPRLDGGSQGGVGQSRRAGWRGGISSHLTSGVR